MSILKDKAIRNTHTDTVTVFGDRAFDKDGKEITINTTKVNEEQLNLKQIMIIKNIKEIEQTLIQVFKIN